MKSKIKAIAIQIGSVLCCILAAMLLPFILLATFVVAARRALAEWRVVRQRLQAGDVTCSVDSHCPSGYACIGGRCMPSGA